MTSFPRRRSDLEYSTAVIDGDTVYNVKDPVTGTYFRLREPEYRLLQQLDGTTPYEQIAAAIRREFNVDLSAEAIEQFVEQLRRLNFLEDSRAEQAVFRKSYAAGKGRSLFSRLLFVKVKAFKPGRVLDSLARLYRPFHRRGWFVAEWIAILFGFGLLVANSRYFYIDLTEIFHIGSLLAVILSVFIVVTLHELAHAVVCRYHGGQVREMGFLLLYFQPCFYTDLSDAWMFSKKSQRLAVTWAGPFFQFLLLALAVAVWRVTVVGSFVNEVARIITVVCWLTVLFNFNPLLKLDGYYLLSDWVDIPNLRQKSFAFLSNFFKRKILGWPLDPYPASPREQRIYLVYALLALIYSAFLIFYIVVVVARFLVAKLGGWGFVLLLAILYVTLQSTLRAIVQDGVQHLRYMPKLMKNPIRLAAHIVIVVAVLIVVLAVPFPHRVAGEVTVQPIEEFTLLLNKFGLLERTFRRGGASPESKSSYLQMTSNEMAALDLIPLVQDGMPVRPGDTLAVLVSNQVTKELIANIALLQKHEGELALLKSPPKKEQVSEAEAQVVAARAQVDQLTREAERKEELAVRGLASTEDLEAIRSKVDIANAELSNKRSRLDLLKSPPKPEEEAVILSEIDTQRAKVDFLKHQVAAQSVTSPIAGVVVIHRFDEQVLSVSDNHQVELLVPVSDFDIQLVRTGQAVKVKTRTYPGSTFTGEVVHVPKGAQEFNGRMSFLTSVLIDNPDGLLGKGMSGYAKIQVGQSSLIGLMWRKILSFIRVEFWSWW
ncbi:MAG TPA: PqqD family peptide modification chaperone [Candidatus Deferrimicrobium sp.]|nr:PqqD family peptide modification chaperone [Candidatus Deferrimicrobium sp.]